MTSEHHPDTPDTADHTATVTPLRRPRRPRRHGEVTVERIETTSMTPEEYRRAVTALAELVNEWKHRTRNTDEYDEKAA